MHPRVERRSELAWAVMLDKDNGFAILNGSADVFEAATIERWSEGLKSCLRELVLEPDVIAYSGASLPTSRQS